MKETDRVDSSDGADRRPDEVAPAADDDPLATVVITTHDRPVLAQRAIRSALAQTISDIEVVVVDDGSTPAFAAEVDDDRVRVIRRPRAAGVSAARNLGLGTARGAWVTFLDDDDILVPDMLRRSIAAAEQSHLSRPVAAMSSVTVLGLDGEEATVYVPAPALRRGEDYFLERRGSAGRTCTSLVAPTLVMRSIGGFDEQLDAFQHADLGLRLNAVASIQGIEESLYRMTTHPGPRMSARAATIPLDMERTLAKHPDAFARHRASHAHFMGTIGVYHLKAGSWREAVTWSLRALRRDPRQRRLWMFAAASLAGPHVLGAYRRLRRPNAGVSASVLTRRRVRKYSRRLANYPRALVGVPLALVTEAMLARNGRTSKASSSRSVLLLSVYRERNAPYLAPIVADAVSLRWEVRLWALDRVAPELAASTVGTSPGAKFPLLNQLLEHADLDRYDWVVVVDDDVVVRSGSLGDLLDLAEAAGLDLAQPAHTELSHRDHEMTVRRPLTVARRTSYVEIGPVFVVGGTWISEVLPFPPEHEMGWGLELEWLDLARRGARLGIVDAVAVRHLGPIGRGYSQHDEGDRMRALLWERGLGSLREVQRTIETWRPWQARPPWSS